MVDFLIIAFVIFMIVRTLNKAREKMAAEEEKTEEKKDDEQVKLLKEIRDEIRKKK